MNSSKHVIYALNYHMKLDYMFDENVCLHLNILSFGYIIIMQLKTLQVKYDINFSEDFLSTT